MDIASQASEDSTLLKSLGLTSSDTPSTPITPSTPTSTNFPPLPGSSIDVDLVNQKLSKIQSSIDDGFAQVISRISAMNLLKQTGGTRKKRAHIRKSRRHRQKK